MEQELTEVQKKLCKVLRPLMNDDESYLGTMLFLIADQENPDENCKQMLEFLEHNSQATNEEVAEELEKILNIV